MLGVSELFFIWWKERKVYTQNEKASGVTQKRTGSKKQRQWNNIWLAHYISSGIGVIKKNFLVNKVYNEEKNFKTPTLSIEYNIFEL